MQENLMPTYLELGFDAFGLRSIKPENQISANMADYLLEISENSVSNKNVKSVSADKITAGTLSAVTNVGDESIKLDGEAKEIKIYDDSGNVSVLIKGGSA